MQTYSHLLINAALSIGFIRNKKFHWKGFCLGSILPDLPLYVLSFGMIMVQSQLFFGDQNSFWKLYDTYFFEHPLWIISYNYLHASFILLTIVIVGKWLTKRGVPRTSWIVSFAWGCWIHTLCDIFTHHDDGPLIFFPFDWHYRFISAISYWDKEHFAQIVFPIEHLMDALLLIFITYWLIRRKKDNCPSADRSL